MNSNVIAILLERIRLLEERMDNAALNAVQPWHNLNAGATAPTVNDDSTLGFGKGSVWVSDTATYICRSSAVGAAVWDDVTGGSAFGGDVDDLTTNTGNAGEMVRVAGAGGLEYRTPTQVRTDIGATTIGGNVFTSTNPSAIAFGRANADNTFSWLSASAFRTAIGATTVGANFFTATNPSAVTYIRVNADNTVSFLSAADFITALNLSGLYVTLGTSQTVTATKSWSALQTFLAGIRIGDNSTANLGIQFSVPGVNWDFATGGSGNISLSNGNGAYVTYYTASITTQFFGAVGFGTASPSARVHILPTAANQIGLIVQALVGQSVNLQEWRDSGGTMMSAIDEDGIFILANDTKRAAQRAELKIDNRATIVPFHAESDGTITLTDQALAEQFLSNSSRNITKIDLTQYTQCRLITRVTTGSASANSPRLRVRYRTTFSTTVGDYSDIGTSEISTSLTSTGVVDSGWVNLAAGALADIFLTITQLGGDGAADPAYGMVMVHFR